MLKITETSQSTHSCWGTWFMGRRVLHSIPSVLCLSLRRDRSGAYFTHSPCRDLFTISLCHFGFGALFSGLLLWINRLCKTSKGKQNHREEAAAIPIFWQMTHIRLDSWWWMQTCYRKHLQGLTARCIPVLVTGLPDFRTEAWKHCPHWKGRPPPQVDEVERKILETSKLVLVPYILCDK